MKNNKGQALVEFIIVLPILLLIIMSIIDLGNIFVKKYSIENHIDIVYKMYLNDDNDNISRYVKDNDLLLNYENNDGVITINLSKTVNINTPILSNILGKKYKVEVSRFVYE